MPRFRTLLLIILLLIALLGGTCWLFSAQILNELLRPQIEQTLTQRLDAQVAIERMNWTGAGLAVTGVRIQRGEQFQLQLPGLEVEFTLRGLWNRHLSALRLHSPQLVMTLPDASGPKTGAQIIFPEELPLQIDQVQLSQGELLCNLAERQLRLRQIDVTATLAKESPFSLSALLGSDDRHPLTVNGLFQFKETANLTLSNIGLSEKKLLTAPLKLQLGGAGFTQGGGTLQLANFDDQQLRDLLRAVEISSPLPDSAHFALQEIEITLALQKETLSSVIKIAHGRVTLPQLELPFSTAELSLALAETGWQAQGKLQTLAKAALQFSATGSKAQINGTAGLDLPQPNRLKTALLGGEPPGVAGGLAGEINFALAGEQLQLSASFRGRKAAAPADYLLDLAQLSGQLELQRKNKTDEITLKLDLGKRPLLAAEGTLQQFSFSLVPQNLLQLRQLIAPNLFPAQLSALRGVSASGQVSQTEGTGWQARVVLNAEQLQLSGMTLADLNSQASLRFEGSRLSFNNFIFKAGVHQSAENSALLSGELSGQMTPDHWALDLRDLTLGQLNYLAKDGQAGIGNGRLSLMGALRGERPLTTITLDISGSAGAEEGLWGALYADLSKLRSRLQLNGRYFIQQQQLALKNLELKIPTLGSLVGSGQLSPQQLEVTGSLELPDLATSYPTHLAPLLEGVYPLSRGLVLAGGLSLASRLSWQPGGWQARGELRPQGLTALWPRYRLEMRNGSGSIPYNLQQAEPPGEDKNAPQQSGQLSFAVLSVGLANLADGQLQLSAAANHFSFLSPLRLQLAGGQVLFENLNLGWGRQGPQGSVRVNIDSVDLGHLTAELELPEMQGRFSGDLGQLRYADEQLSTEGTVKLNVFGGRIMLRNMRYSDPFSRYPIFHADIDVLGLDLLQATRTFEFGEMNGIVDGSVRSLRLFGTTPSAFEAEFATRTKGKRNISVKALNNLSIISQGGISAALSKGIYRFIDFYRYNKIGFECALENDTFTLRGTARPGTEKYLVYGSLLPPRIDITTTTPTISFKEMVRRLSRIDRAGS